jgi:ribonuclease VapC
MTIFVDASALIAIITGEPDADTLADRLDADRDRICSTLSWETVAGLVRSQAVTMEYAWAQVRRYLEAGAIRLVPLAERDYDLAIEAYARFGKGRHPAALKMGDCHAYAGARAHGATLLFKGDAFSRTDIDQAGP